MTTRSRLRSIWEWFLSIGSYPGETDAQRGKRRIVAGYIAIRTPPTLFFMSLGFAEGHELTPFADLVAAVVPILALVALHYRPHWYSGVVNVLLATLLLENLAPSIMTGGIVEGGYLMVFALIVVVGAFLALDRRAAFRWFIAYVASVFLAAVLPEFIDPIQDPLASTSSDLAGIIVFVGLFLYLGMAYFVRQRDRFQQESDDLLHNILPDEIALRLKSDTSMIADDYESASVLFADVVNFTPMSATLTPAELVGLLNNVFTTFDRFVEELGLEKIKTVGDEYMVASGVPRIRPDHAHAIAELALQMRDYCAKHRFDGHDITLRIGINSGPVVAGVVGTHKFAYDLWGDVVNTASRMESEGIAGRIQISDSTYQLIKNDYVCEARGEIQVKGKGSMHTWLLVGPNHNQSATPPAVHRHTTTMD